MDDRSVSWDGFFNARDLGGLPTIDGESTQWSRVFRSATLHLVTSAGWEQAYAAGVRTVVSLLNDDEVPPGAAAGDAAGRMTRVRVALDVVEDTEMWTHIEAAGIDGTPLYFVPLLGRHPERLADAVRVIARAEPGGVLFHCGAGRDRTGLVAALLLSLADVSRDAIVADYLESSAALRSLAEAMGRPSEQHLIDEALQKHGHTVETALREVLSSLDASAVLERGGLDDADRAAARARLRAHEQALPRDEGPYRSHGSGTRA